jgi:hypothetical protein
MKSLSVWIATGCILALLSGCSTPKRTIAIAPPQAAPEWYLNPPANDAQWLYGTGEGGTINEAKNEALSALLSRLSVQTRSSFEVRTTSQMGDQRRYDQKMAREIHSEVAQIRVGNHELHASQQLTHDRFVALVRSDRQAFTTALKGDIDQALRHIEGRLTGLKQHSIIQRHSFLGSASQKGDQLRLKVAILEGLEPGFDGGDFLARIASIQRAYDQVSSRLRFTLQAAHSHEAQMGEVIKSALSHEGYRLDSQPGEGLLSITLRVDSAISQARGLTIADIVLVIEVSDDKGGMVGGHRHPFRLGAERGIDRAVEGAASKLEQRIDTQGIMSVLGVAL